MPDIQRFIARGTYPASGKLLLTVQGQGGPTYGANTWHVITLRAAPHSLINNTGDLAVFYFGVGNSPPPANAAGFGDNNEDYVCRTYSPPGLPSEAWFPYSDASNERRPGGIIVDIGQVIYAVVDGGTVGRRYFFSGLAVEFDP